MKLLHCFVFSLLIAQATARETSPRYRSPLSAYSREWDAPKYKQCNTAEHATYMTEKEREVIFILNLARMNPKLFCKTVVKNAHRISGMFDTSSEQYYKSLVTAMSSMDPLPLLKPDSLCTISARSHAISSGRNDYTGHVRQSPESKKLTHFSGECCHYGAGVPLHIVLSLLIDQNVESLGHRKICFGGYKKIGTGIAPHTTYGSASVLDFHY